VKTTFDIKRHSIIINKRHDIIAVVTSLIIRGLSHYLSSKDVSDYQGCLNISDNALDILKLNDLYIRVKKIQSEHPKQTLSAMWEPEQVAQFDYNE